WRARSAWDTWATSWSTSSWTRPGPSTGGASRRSSPHNWTASTPRGWPYDRARTDDGSGRPDDGPGGGRGAGGGSRVGGGRGSGRVRSRGARGARGGRGV